jgi:hypothetical protein
MRHDPGRLGKSQEKALFRAYTRGLSRPLLSRLVHVLTLPVESVTVHPLRGVINNRINPVFLILIEP